MIHQALQDMAVREIGAAEWEALLRERGHDAPLFIGMEYYADEVTMALMHLLAGRIDLPLDDFLRAFGRIWIDFAGATAYGRILDMAGDDFPSFLESLDRMHSSIRSNMPRADMPSFEVLAIDDGAIELLYRSSRSGLEPFVQGILSAAAERFGERVEIAHRPDLAGTRFSIARIGRHE
ncbi:MAG: heme NO-binding domain-containing protein [Alkalilacustris sp.]